MNVLYTATARAAEDGRNGHVRSEIAAGAGIGPLGDGGFGLTVA